MPKGMGYGSKPSGRRRRRRRRTGRR